MISLYSALSALKGCEPKTIKQLNKLGISHVFELINYLPKRYLNFGPTKLISQIPDSGLTRIMGRIDLIANRRSFKKRIIITEALVKDKSGSIKVLWFNQPFTIKNLEPGDVVSLAGKIGQSYGQSILLSPQYEKITGKKSLSLPMAEIVPVYGLSGTLTQKQIRNYLSQTTDIIKNIPEWLPKNIITKLNLPALNNSIYEAHFPQTESQALEAKKRLSFDQLFIHQLKTYSQRKHQSILKAPKIFFQEEAILKLIKSLPFSLTANQKKASWDIIKDLDNERPMQRIVQGDVGSGKTVVAAIAALNVAMTGKQTLIMAPTEILAKQHYESFTKLLKDFKPPIGLLTSSVKKKDKQKIAKESLIIIGTSALIQDGLEYNDPALAIVDEQHRFGVGQRKKLKQAQENFGLHFLSLSATPIPRSLALSIYGELDISIIKEKPQGRKAIKTLVIKEEQREKLYGFIKKEVANKKQVYIICPLVEDSDNFEAKSAKAEQSRLEKEIFPDLNVGLLHGQMKNNEKNQIMEDFINNKIQILVSTSVVEVGMDNPNATIMFIEGAERFGLAQLHQFRGRVGRGQDQSYCFLSPSPDSKNNKRLKAMEKNDDGFELAKIDLKHRGSGSLYGLEQSGFKELEIATLFDYQFLQESAKEAEKIINTDPELTNFPKIKDKLGDFDNNIHWE